MVIALMAFAIVAFLLLIDTSIMPSGKKSTNSNLVNRSTNTSNTNRTTTTNTSSTTEGTFSTNTNTNVIAQ